MKIALFGGTGFVGSYLLDELLRRGHSARLLVRSGSEAKVIRDARCEPVTGTIADSDAVRRTVEGVDAVVYNIGILKEYPSRGVTFQALHVDGLRLAVSAAEAAGVRRFGLMSANGARADGTAYQQTKALAEACLQASNLDWTIFRPSVMFGDPRGRMEFATQLYRDLVSLPLPVPLFHEGWLPFGAGTMELSPIHVEDVVRVMVAALDHSDSVGRIYALGGPHKLAWKQILEIIGEAVDKRVFGIPTPAWAVKTAARLLERTGVMPVTHDQIVMLMEGNTCDSETVFRVFGVDPLVFEPAQLRYLRQPSVQDATRQAA